MAKAKGSPKTGGRKPGSLNKCTREFRETVRVVLENNADNVGKWLTMVAEGDSTGSVMPDPAKALDLIAKLAEFASPKLARTEHSGLDGNAIQTVTSIRLIDMDQA